jgi:peptidoglycan/xylan/chitin deacetylase (PgdA/CDA1 family)
MMTRVPRLRSLLQTAKSMVTVLGGLSLLARGRGMGSGSVLTFHGLYDETQGEIGVLDDSLHLSRALFELICQHLAEDHQVMSLLDMVRCLAHGQELPLNAVAITFDDGFLSNHELALPILERYALPATIFLCTGFLDNPHSMWYQQVDLAYAAGARLPDVVADLPSHLRYLKEMKDPELRQLVAQMCGSVSLPETLPAVMRPMSWQQARLMKASGLIEFGGHTHTHPILAQCTLAQQVQEVQGCWDRIVAELGIEPRLFAYPNGHNGDFTAETQRIVAETGFEAAFTMQSGRLQAGLQAMALPRYGCPQSIWEAEATVSGALEWLKRPLQRRGGGK